MCAATALGKPEQQQPAQQHIDRMHEDEATNDSWLPPLLLADEGKPSGATVPLTGASWELPPAFELPVADEELAQALAMTLNLALKASKAQHKPRRCKRAGATTTAAAAAAAAGLEQHCPENLGKRYTVELTTAAKAARIVRNRAFAKKSLERTKGRIAELEAENAALAAKDAALSRQLDAMLAWAVARLQH